MSAAEKIYQAQLDAVSKALWEGKFSELADMMFYPHIMTNHDTEIRVDSPDQLIAAAKEFRKSLIRLGTSEYHRTCVKAAFVEGRDDVIEGEHVTYALRSGTYAIEPMVAYMTLHLIGDRWLGAGIRYVVHNRDLALVTLAETAAQRRA